LTECYGNIRPSPIGTSRRRGDIFQKRFLRGAVVGLLFAAAFSLWLSTDALKPVPSLQENIYREYIQLYGGEATEEKIKTLSEEIEHFDAVISREDETAEAYETGKLPVGEYSAYLSELYKAKTRRAAAGTVCARMIRLLGTDGRIIYDTWIISVSLSDGVMKLRMISDDPPGNAVPVVSTLEDAYLSIYGSRRV